MQPRRAEGGLHPCQDPAGRAPHPGHPPGVRGGERRLRSCAYAWW